MRAAVVGHIKCALDIIDRKALVAVLNPLHFTRRKVRGFAKDNLIGHARILPKRRCPGWSLSAAPVF